MEIEVMMSERTKLYIYNLRTLVCNALCESGVSNTRYLLVSGGEVRAYNFVRFDLFFNVNGRA